MDIDIKNAVNNLLIACDSIKKHSSGDVYIKSIDELVIVDILTFIDYISKELKISNYECKKLYSVCDNFSVETLCIYIDLAYSVE